MSKESFTVVFCLVTVLTTVAPNVRSQEEPTDEPNSPPYDPNGTPAELFNEDFSQIDYDWAVRVCDGKSHPLPEKVAALSDGWFETYVQCGQLIKIMANGTTAFATVVGGCAMHIDCGLRVWCPNTCGTKDIIASHAVWDDLGFNPDVGGLIPRGGDYDLNPHASDPGPDVDYGLAVTWTLA